MTQAIQDIYDLPDRINYIKITQTRNQDIDAAVDAAIARARAEDILRQQQQRESEFNSLHAYREYLDETYTEQDLVMRILQVPAHEQEDRLRYITNKIQEQERLRYQQLFKTPATYEAAKDALTAAQNYYNATWQDILAISHTSYISACSVDRSSIIYRLRSAINSRTRDECVAGLAAAQAQGQIAAVEINPATPAQSCPVSIHDIAVSVSCGQYETNLGASGKYSATSYGYHTLLTLDMILNTIEIDPYSSMTSVRHLKRALAGCQQYRASHDPQIFLAADHHVSAYRRWTTLKSLDLYESTTISLITVSRQIEQHIALLHERACAR